MFIKGTIYLFFGSPPSHMKITVNSFKQVDHLENLPFQLLVI